MSLKCILILERLNLICIWIFSIYGKVIAYFSREGDNLLIGVFWPDAWSLFPVKNTC